MNQRPWQRALTRMGGAFVLCAVPAVALAWLTPSAWSALATGGARTEAAASALALVADSTHETSDVLDQWTDTKAKAKPKSHKKGSIPLTNALVVSLRDLAHQESTILNDGVDALRKQLATLKDGTQAKEQAQERLNLVFAERNAWDATWKMIGVPGADQTAVFLRLSTLQVNFKSADVSLAVAQTQQTSTNASTSGFTVPTF